MSLTAAAAGAAVISCGYSLAEPRWRINQACRGAPCDVAAAAAMVTLLLLLLSVLSVWPCHVRECNQACGGAP
jgi:hypothetical protein